jgi:hypothetical protein
MRFREFVFLHPPKEISGRFTTFYKVIAIYGGIAGLAVWFRPEALFFVLFLVLWKLYDVYRYKKIAGLYFTSAVVLMGILFIGYNMMAYHHPMGLHAAQVLDKKSIIDKIKSAFHILAVYGAKGILYDPIVISVVVIFLLHAKKIYADYVQDRNVIIILMVGVVIFYAGSIWILPNTGGLNWGIRYALVCTPSLYVLFMLVFDKYVSSSRYSVHYVIVILVIIGYGIFQNSYLGAKHLYRRNHDTKLALHQFLQQHKLDVVLVSQSNMAGEFYGIMQPSTILLAESREHIDAYLNHPETKGLDFVLLYEVNNPYSKVKLKQEELSDFYEDTIIGDFIIYKQKKLLVNQ